MIAFVEGTLVKKTGNSVVMATAAGLGYEVFVSVTDLERMPAMGSQLRLYTYLQVKEDGIALFGFVTEEERQIFKWLLTVNGIGPRGALSILSGISVENLRFAVLAEDVKTISKIPGIGAKTAGKLILELKDKFRLEEAPGAALFSSEATGQELSKKEEAAQALVALGYSRTEAIKVLNEVALTETTTVEQLIKQGLKNL